MTKTQRITILTRRRRAPKRNCLLLLLFFNFYPPSDDAVAPLDEIVKVVLDMLDMPDIPPDGVDVLAFGKPLPSSSDKRG